MNIPMSSDQYEGTESVHPESNWVSVVEMDNDDSEWLDWKIYVLFIRKRKRAYDVSKDGVGKNWKL